MALFVQKLFIWAVTILDCTIFVAMPTDWEANPFVCLMVNWGGSWLPVVFRLSAVLFFFALRPRPIFVVIVAIIHLGLLAWLVCAL